MKTKNIKTIKWFLYLILIPAFLYLTNWFLENRIWQKITLFDEEKRMENFRHMENICPRRMIRRNGPVFYFQKEFQPLMNVSYQYKNTSSTLEKFLARTITTGFLVIQNDKIVMEQYFRGSTEDSLHTSWSVAKSVLSALVGIAIDDQLITGVNQPVTKYIPALRVSGYNQVPIKDILTMSSGVRFNEDYDDFFADINTMFYHLFFWKQPLDEYIAGLESERPPGTYNQYKSVDTQILGMLIRETTGKSPAQYLEEKIWSRIGMESDAFWSIDGTGMELAFCCLNATLRDYAKFGRLYLKKGNWDGKRILSEQWIEESVVPGASHLQPGENPNSDWTFGYQYQWWIPENPIGQYAVEQDYVAIGIWGQYIYINPKQNLIIVKNSVDPNFDSNDHETIAVFRAIAQYLATIKK